MANHFGQFGASAGWHVHVEDDQVGLEIGQFRHRLNRFDQGTRDDAGAVEQALGVQGLGPRVVDDQHFERLVLGDAGQQLDFLQQARGLQGAGEKFLAAGAHGGQAGRGIGFVQAEKQQRHPLFQALLGLGGQLQADTGAGEVDVHDDRRGQSLAHGRLEGGGAVQGLYTQAEEFQLLGQAFGAVVVLEHDVHRLAQRRQRYLLKLVALAQAGARQALHQPVEFADQLAAQARAVGLDRLQGMTDGFGQLAMLGLLEALGIALQAQVGFAQLTQVASGPLAALQALPDFEDLPGLMNDPLGKVLLEALTIGVFWLGHVLTTY
ncbi:hypothetical protein D3C81_780190 [compost metagenome]